jgi:hypothetical protein
MHLFGAFGPEMIAVMTAVLEAACKELKGPIDHTVASVKSPTDYRAALGDDVCRE